MKVLCLNLKNLLRHKGCQVSSIEPDCPVFWLFVDFKNDSNTQGRPSSKPMKHSPSSHQIFSLYTTTRLIPDNACVNNSSIFCATDIGTASVRYFGESHLATLGTTFTQPHVRSLFFKEALTGLFTLLRILSCFIKKFLMTVS